MKVFSGTSMPVAERNISIGKCLLWVRDLEVRVSIERAHSVFPLKGVSFQIAIGEIVGLLGESGAGKTTLAMALLRLLPSSFRITGGSIQFEDRELLSLSEAEL
jgi:ABC-type glutathione transport system ATPase component